MIAIKTVSIEWSNQFANANQPILQKNCKYRMIKWIYEFKSAVDCHRKIVATSQRQTAQEICSKTEVEIGLNQSTVSKI